MRASGIGGFLGILIVIVVLYRGWLRRGRAAGLPATRRIISGEFRPPPGSAIRVAMFDADSTLRVAPSGSPSANFATDVALLPMVAEPIKNLASDGFLIAIISNQAGVEAGHITLETAEHGFQTTIRKLREFGVTIHYYDFAERRNEDRKPDIGMGVRLARAVEERFGREIDWKGSLMVGDSAWKTGQDQEPGGAPGDDISNTDRLFAENLRKKFGGVTFLHPRDFFGWVKLGVKNFKTYAELQGFLKANPEVRP